MTPAQHRQAREIVNGYEDRHKHLRGYYSRTDLLTVAKLALAQIIADCEYRTPFGWWDKFNEVFWRNEADAKAARAGGNEIVPLYADCEASSDPLAVAARMERAEAEVARLREAMQMVQSYFWGTELPVMKEGDVQQFVEAALGKDGQ